MSIIWTIVIGFVVGLIARFLLPGKQAMGIILTTLLGIAGAVVAAYGGQALGLYQQGQPAGFIGAVVGAIIVLFIVGAIRGRD